MRFPQTNSLVRCRLATCPTRITFMPVFVRIFDSMEVSHMSALALFHEFWFYGWPGESDLLKLARWRDVVIRKMLLMIREHIDIPGIYPLFDRVLTIQEEWKLDTVSIIGSKYKELLRRSMAMCKVDSEDVVVVVVLTQEMQWDVLCVVKYCLV